MIVWFCIIGTWPYRSSGHIWCHGSEETIKSWIIYTVFSPKCIIIQIYDCNAFCLWTKRLLDWKCMLFPWENNMTKLNTQLERFIMVKPIHPVSNLRVDSNIIFMTNYSFSKRTFMSITNAHGDFVNLKIKSAQTFEDTYRVRCECMYS
jgi:hypothetical protein